MDGEDCTSILADLAIQGDRAMPDGQFIEFEWPADSQHERLCCRCGLKPGAGTVQIKERVLVKRGLLTSTYRDVWTVAPICAECRQSSQEAHDFAALTQGGLYMRFSNRAYQGLFDPLNSPDVLEFKRINGRVLQIPELLALPDSNRAALLHEVDQLLARMNLLGRADMAAFYKAQFKKYR
jgi:hypothetical protein